MFVLIDDIVVDIAAYPSAVAGNFDLAFIRSHCSANGNPNLSADVTPAGVGKLVSTLSG